MLSGKTLIIIFLWLPFPSPSKSEDQVPKAQHDFSINEEKDAIVFDNCDVDTYYKDHKDNAWRWNREEVASLLLRTHRQIIPSEASIDTDSREALAELDKGKYINAETYRIETVHMIFTQTDIPVDNGLLLGWEPGYVWPLDELIQSSFNETENYIQEDYQDELSAATHDLHNIRPRHPIVHGDHQMKNWYYDTCNDCYYEGKEISSQQQLDGRISGTRPKWDRVDFDDKELNSMFDDDEGSDHLCLCIEEHALQPPEEARGEVARALLYMNLRYGTLTAAHAKHAVRRNLNVDFLDLTLTDCPPMAFGDRGDSGSGQETTNRMGYFSRLVQWHLEDPPSQHEIDRNQKICERYQGNRNPFVDFYEESWTLLDFDSIEREECMGKGDSNHQGESNDDYYNDDFAATANPISGEQDKYGCGDLMPGDISFFMIQPATDSDQNNDVNQDEEWKRESFGLVTLVDLKPGLTLYVAGVDDDVGIPTASAVVSEEEHTGDNGVLKVTIPDKGIPIGSFFGYGKQLYLGDQWEQVLIDDEDQNYKFSVHQLYLYCINREDGIGNSSTTDEYKILAAMSTTGHSFGKNGLSSYWEKFQNHHSNIIVSETFSDGIHYGMIVLPEDASDSNLSGGYQYMGPTYTKQDKYAKALIDEANWKRMKSLREDLKVYGRRGEQPSTNVLDPEKLPSNAIDEMQQQVDDKTTPDVIGSSSGESLRPPIGIRRLSLIRSLTNVVVPFIIIIINC
eukprot:jgi/Psemu1/210396/e_gw1.532.43.1